MIKKWLKHISRYSPVGFTRNHSYDIQTKKIIQGLGRGFNSIDVGCHEGEILDVILKYSPGGRHFGVEALPHMAEDLRSKYDDKQNVQILEFAASTKSDWVEFNYVLSNPSYSGMIKRDYDRPNEKDEKIRVKTERLDDHIPESLKIHLIKIDVEGAELGVLQGASRIISAHKPLVIFEHGLGAANHYGTSPMMIYDFFSEREMKVSNLGAYLKGNPALSVAELERQFHANEHYYFVGHG